MTSPWEFLRRAFPAPPYHGPPVTKSEVRRWASVQWVDSASVNGGLWVSRDEIDPSVMTKDGLTQRTLGWIIDESDDVLLLAQSIGVDRLGAVLAIPKVAIVG
jgi:hypothetical protein